MYVAVCLFGVVHVLYVFIFFFFKQKTAYERRIIDWSSDVCSSDLAKRPNSNAGKYHLGGYFDQDDPTAEAFRVLAAKTRRKQQDLLGEAISDLVAKYDARAKFGS